MTIVPRPSSRVHVTPESAALEELTPGHDPRVETATYRRAHHFLVVVEDSACEICGVRQSTLADPAQNPTGASAIETHHYPIERSLMNACDPAKVHRIAPVVFDAETLLVWVDSPGNLKVLCSTHHRDPDLGIHHLLSQDFAILPYLKDGYIIAAHAEDIPTDLALDQAIEDETSTP